MSDYPYSLKQIAEITGKSNTALFSFIKEEQDFINCHTQKNGRFVKYDEEALQAFIKRFGRVAGEGGNLSPTDAAQTAPETPSNEVVGDREGEPKSSVIAAFEAQIEALKKERDELANKLEARERDCSDWRTQAGQALSALSKEQERVERLEERLAGFLPAPNTSAGSEADKPIKRKLTFSERIGVLFGRELDFK